MVSKFIKHDFLSVLFFLIPLILFAGILSIRIPESFSYLISVYSPFSFCLVLPLAWLSFRLPGKYGLLAGLSLSMLLFALSLSNKWASGYTDNMMIGGLVPYKDGKNFYVGARLILDGLPLQSRQATWRPVFPGLLSTLLFFTQQNLKTSLSLLAGLTGIVFYLSARRVSRQFGALPASVFFTFLYFYAFRFVGYTLSELTGLLMGSLAFLLLWQAAFQSRWFDAILGLIVLMAAVSARSGAFLIFPLLILWIGWIFRRGNRFSFPAAGWTAAIVLLSFSFINTLYPLWVGVPEGSAFSNFAHALYGQVQGGTGWHSAIDDLGDVDPAVIYRAAWANFLDHPLSVVIGAAKSYRDLFFSGHDSFFQLDRFEYVGGFEVLVWAVGTFLLVWGLVRLVKTRRYNQSALFLAGFIGIFLSVPFLPPVDGGFRFYASTMPFFYVIPTYAVAVLTGKPQQEIELEAPGGQERAILRYGVLSLLALAMAFPVVIHTLGRPPVVEAPVCPAGQIPFAFKANPGSYIDIVSDSNTDCGQAPRICFSDFETNAVEKNFDDFAQELIALSRADPQMVRLTPAKNLVGQKTFHYFFQPSSAIAGDPSGQIISGCATEISTSKMSIFFVNSLVTAE
jgi:hypothetical protein